MKPAKKTLLDYCSCRKPEGTYGLDGWHWRINPDWPEYRAQDTAYEHCPAYRRAVHQEGDKT